MLGRPVTLAKMASRRSISYTPDDDDDVNQDSRAASISNAAATPAPADDVQQAVDAADEDQAGDDNEEDEVDEVEDDDNDDEEEQAVDTSILPSDSKAPSPTVAVPDFSAVGAGKTLEELLGDEPGVPDDVNPGSASLYSSAVGDKL